MDLFEQYNTIYEMPLNVQSELFKSLAERFANEKLIQLITIIIFFYNVFRICNY